MELLIQRRRGFEVNSLVSSIQWPFYTKDTAMKIIKDDVLPKEFHHLAPALLGEKIDGVKVSYLQEGLLIEFPDSMIPKEISSKLQGGLDSQGETR